MADSFNLTGMTLDSGVIKTIVSIAAADFEGIRLLGSRKDAGSLSFFQQDSSISYIECHMEDDKIAISLHVEVEYGYSIPRVVAAFRRAIADILLVQVGLEVSHIDVYVDYVYFSKR